MRKKGLGVSPLTNTIYYGMKDSEKHEWVGQKTDVTKEAIAAVFEWFIGNMEDYDEDSEDEKEEFSITYPTTQYELVMRRKGKKA